MENGHSWLSIKQYTLSEIGIFYKTVVLGNRDRKIDTLSNIWMGNNLAYEGFKEVIADLGVTPQKEAGPSIAEVNKDWKRLATFMAGRK